jgi:hypothetical protein
MVTVVVAVVVMLMAVALGEGRATGSAWVHKGVECWPGQPGESI